MARLLTHQMSLALKHIQAHALDVEIDHIIVKVSNSYPAKLPCDNINLRHRYKTVVLSRKKGKKSLQGFFFHRNKQKVTINE